MTFAIRLLLGKAHISQQSRFYEYACALNLTVRTVRLDCAGVLPIGSQLEAAAVPLFRPTRRLHDAVQRHERPMMTMCFIPQPTSARSYASLHHAV